MPEKPCSYCQRPMETKASRSLLTMTRDHYPVARKDGGTRTVAACYQCNQIKGALSAEEWDAFMLANPRWWTLPQYQMPAPMFMIDAARKAAASTDRRVIMTAHHRSASLIGSEDNERKRDRAAERVARLFDWY